MTTPRSGVLRGAGEEHHRSPAPPAACKRGPFLFHELLRSKESEEDAGDQQHLKAKASFLPDNQEVQTQLIYKEHGRMW